MVLPVFYLGEPLVYLESIVRSERGVNIEILRSLAKSMSVRKLPLADELFAVGDTFSLSDDPHSSRQTQAQCGQFTV